MGILKTQDRLLSSRIVPTAFQQASLIPHSLIWSECNPTWKSLRTLCRAELFSAKALEAHSRLRQEKLGNLLDFLRSKQGQVIDAEDVVFTTLFNTLSSIIFGKDLLDFKDEHGTQDELKESLRTIIKYGGRVKDLGSFFPMLERFDLHGIRKGTMKEFNKAFAYWEDIIEERRVLVNSSTWSSEQAQSFLDRMLENGFSNNQINQMVMELFVAGTNTTTCTVMWAMTELVKHKEVMSKIEEEMKKELNSEQITSSQLSKLTYLQACIKENFRLHPPVPLLLPHMAAETCEIVVVASSPEAAMGILKTQDRLLSSRIVPTAFQQASLIPHSLIWSECNPTWKSLRTLCRAELFSAKALEAHSRLRQEKLGNLLDFLRKQQGQVIDAEDVVFTTLFNTLSTIIFGKDLLDFKEEHGTQDKLKESLRTIIEYGGRVKDLGFFFPMLDRFDLHGIRKGTMKEFNKAFAYWEDIIEERRVQVNSSTWSSEQAQSFLDRMLENGFSNNQINQMVMELFIAGTNTTTSTVMWAMTELVRHKEVMSKIEEEMKKEFNSDQITNSEISKLTYLQACIKENFRLHPPVPLLLPHMAEETCEFDWAIPNGEDPSTLDMDDKFGIALKRKTPLNLIFKQKQENTNA
ncbi:hypothetical protein L1987_48916 [Smallanthus sonchifolius]|uniref:Uncharacterized protein n=1 Tax=Smallanthus sonchifolius TaxID=185202 RepID=A0ACB9FT92_9ASTR|nr:hypothetical protein L1987_48916 [Smallanthus sonchifolius]